MKKLRQWQRFKEIVGSVLERASAERAAYLEQACGQDPELRAEVESLLSAHREADGLSEGPWRDASAELAAQPQVIAPCEPGVNPKIRQ